MTLKNNRAPLLCCFQLCAWFHCHMWIQTGVKSPETAKLGVDLCDLDLWPWPFAWTSLLTMVITPENCMMIRWWEHGEKGVTDGRTDGQTDRRTENTICRAAWSQLKTIGHLFYFASSFVHHFTAISEFKLELESGNAQFWSKSTIFFSRVTLKFNGWPSKTIGHLFYATSSFVHHFIPIGEFKFELQSGNAQFGSKSTIFLAVWPIILRMTLKNNRASLLCYFKLCVSFRTHWGIETGVTVRKRSIWFKLDDF